MLLARVTPPGLCLACAWRAQEGAELDILSKFRPGEWLGVRRLVFEYSFTKRPEMEAFEQVVRRLEVEGFSIAYEGKGNWEGSFETWPWQVDALVYAWR